MSEKKKREKMLKWLNKRLNPHFFTYNFNTDWQDGILLCALCESLLPGLCPRYDLLSSKNAAKNVQFALHLITDRFNIKTVSFMGVSAFVLMFFSENNPERNIQERKRNQACTTSVSNQTYVQ